MGASSAVVGRPLTLIWKLVQKQTALPSKITVAIKDLIKKDKKQYNI